MDKLFCDLKTDEEKAAFFLSGRGYETGVIAHSIQNDVAMAYHRCAEYKKELAALQSQEYTAAIGEAGQAYLDKFKNAHALPAEFRWSELWAVMCVAANTGQTDATQSQDREDADRLKLRLETLRQLYPNAPSDAELDASIDHARRAEGENHGSV